MSGVMLVMYENTIQHNTEQEKNQYNSSTYLYTLTNHEILTVTTNWHIVITSFVSIL